jgi:hypothetical protein
MKMTTWHLLSIAPVIQILWPLTTYSLPTLWINPASNATLLQIQKQEEEEAGEEMQRADSADA